MYMKPLHCTFADTTQALGTHWDSIDASLHHGDQSGSILYAFYAETCACFYGSSIISHHPATLPQALAPCAVGTAKSEFDIPAAPILLPEGPWKEIEGCVCAPKGFKAQGGVGVQLLRCLHVEEHAIMADLVVVAVRSEVAEGHCKHVHGTYPRAFSTTSLLHHTYMHHTYMHHIIYAPYLNIPICTQACMQNCVPVAPKPTLLLSCVMWMLLLLAPLPSTSCVLHLSRTARKF